MTHRTRVDIPGDALSPGTLSPWVQTEGSSLAVDAQESTGDAGDGVDSWPQ